MAISFPRALPSCGFVECTIDLDAGTEASGHARGRRQTVSQVREPVWLARFETAPVDDAERAVWRAWKNSLGANLRTFLAWDSRQGLPLAYWAAGAMPDDGGSPWDGVAAVGSLASPGVIALTGAPAGYAASVGDRIGLEETVSSVAKYGYFEVLEAAVADGSGALAVTVSPLVPSMFTTAAVARLYRPVCEFRMVGGSFSAPSRMKFAPVAFDAVQVL